MIGQVQCVGCKKRTDRLVEITEEVCFGDDCQVMQVGVYICKRCENIRDRIFEAVRSEWLTSRPHRYSVIGEDLGIEL